MDKIQNADLLQVDDFNEPERYDGDSTLLYEGVEVMQES